MGTKGLALLPAHVKPAIIQLTRQSHYILTARMPGVFEGLGPGSAYFPPINFSNSGSLRIVTPNSLALSYFEPGSVPTTT